MIRLIKGRGRRGVTLIEAVLFISIALGLIVGGLVFFQQASLAARTNDAVRSLSSIASETRAAYRTQDSFDGLNESVLISSGAVPTSQINTTPDPDEIVSEWNTRVDVDPSPVSLHATPGSFDPVVSATDAPANKFFTITYNDIPEAACTRLTTASDGNGPIGPGIVTVYVTNAGGTVTTPNPTNASQVSVNGRVTITPGQAATMCGVGDAPVDVTWVLAR